MKKVFVGLSGGVDSAVSAMLLKQATPNNFEKLFGRSTPKGFRGFDVTGVFIKVWQPDFLPCSWREERRDAMKVAIALDIPFLFFDFEDEYKRGVVDKMLDEYKKGRTPNPDVLCNKEVKFGAFWKEAKEMGADYIATGHYAIVEKTGTRQKNTEVFSSQYPFSLREGKDKEKDQTYFLWTLTQDSLSHTLFPVGGLDKSEVRSLARKYHLPVAEKKDSQGICFIGDVSMEEFLSHFITTKPGKVLNTKGEVIGTHRGVLLYTIGERHGFEILKKKSEDGPFYVVSKEMKTNTLTVSNENSEIISLSPVKISVKNINWISEPKNLLLSARIRYRGEKTPINSINVQNSALDIYAVEFKKPMRGLSLGQSIVFYNDDVCLGGGVMDKIL